LLRPPRPNALSASGVLFPRADIFGNAPGNARSPLEYGVIYLSSLAGKLLVPYETEGARRGGEYIMKALILYVIFVTIGALVASAIGYYTEIEVSATASLIVFLALFFANFVVSWLAVVFVMDGSLKDAHGRRAHLDIERAARS
jgi:hypothetical protein